MLALGDKIVSALNLQKTTDTLGRWKAHHLAELALAVRDASEANKAVAKSQLADFLKDFRRASGSSFHYSGGYDEKAIARVLDELLSKN